MRTHHRELFSRNDNLSFDERQAFAEVSRGNLAWVLPGIEIEIEIEEPTHQGLSFFRPVCRALDFLSGHLSVTAVYADQASSLRRLNIRGDTTAIIIPTGRRWRMQCSSGVVGRC